MNFYLFSPHDQRHYNWLIFTPRPEPPYIVVKPRYCSWVCSKCKKIDHDKVFMEGFDSGLLIRAEADIFSSEEGFYCINEKVKRIIDRCGFAGLNLKELSGTKWFVLNVSLLVEADKTAYSFSKAVCTDCGRAREITGLIQFISQIRVPPVGGTFCSPTFDRGGSMNTDRDLFASEDIVAEFKRQSIKAGTFYRLLRAQEEIQYRTAVTERRIFKWPKGAKVII